MSDKIANIHTAKIRLSQLVARGDQDERIIIARDGKPVAQLGPAPRAGLAALSDDDPLLRLDDFAIDGAGGNLTNPGIDHVLYGRPEVFFHTSVILCARL
jgi:antitoxin (DNA-binding transcriptional repressor) of toxin-antitoxin stability system